MGVIPPTNFDYSQVLVDHDRRLLSIEIHVKEVALSSYRSSRIRSDAMLHPFSFFDQLPYGTNKPDAGVVWYEWWFGKLRVRVRIRTWLAPPLNASLQDIFEACSRAGVLDFVQYC